MGKDRSDQVEQELRKYLFIGGVADGKWIATGGKVEYRIPKVPTPMRHAPLYIDVDSCRCVDSYRLEVFGIHGVTRNVYVLIDMPLVDAFDRLLCGYVHVT